MTKKILIAFGTLSGIALAAGALFIASGPPQILTRGWESFLAFVLPQTATSAELKAQYAAGTLRVLVVPGHDNLYSGTACNGVSEADINLELAGYLEDLLKSDGRIIAVTTRDRTTGAYIKELADYFVNQKEAIAEFRDRAKKFTRNLVGAGIFKDNSTSNHGFITKEISDVLYGINRWADEKGMDITLHLHWNGAPGPKAKTFQGWSIYVPDAQYSNASASKGVARAIADSFSEYFAVSNHRFEREGVVGDWDLIAVGAHATRKEAAILIENAYLCEPQFTNPALRAPLLRELAFRIHLGLTTYLAGGNFERRAYETSLLPHRWDETVKLTRGIAFHPEVLALQAGLRRDGFYPPPGKTLEKCPLNGTLGPCTEASITLFKREYKIAEPGILVGPLTLQKLNERYGR